MQLRVLTWNLMHGRAIPGAGRELLDEFGAALAGWDWDVALLQEVPPWWPEPLAAFSGAATRYVLTSRNSLMPVRREVAHRFPDLIKSNGGGCNAILVRARHIHEHRWRRVGMLPERRFVHAVRLEGVWVANVHLQPSEAQARAAAAAVLGWADGGPLILGGDFNLPSLPQLGLDWVAGCGVDHVLVRDLRAGAEIRVLDRGRLSDHVPVLASVTG